MFNLNGTGIIPKRWISVVQEGKLIVLSFPLQNDRILLIFKSKTKIALKGRTALAHWGTVGDTKNCFLDGIVCPAIKPVVGNTCAIFHIELIIACSLENGVALYVIPLNENLA